MPTQAAAAPAEAAKARPGYKPRKRGGEQVWCRSETPTGSRMPIERCYTAQQIEQMEASAEGLKDTLEKTRARCTDLRCSGS